MKIKNRLKEIGREDYQAFLCGIGDSWKKHVKMINNSLTTLVFDTTIYDLQEDYWNYIPELKGDFAYFDCGTKIFDSDFEDSKIRIPKKIWFRFLYHPKTTVVTNITS